MSICYIPRSIDEIRAWLCLVMIPSAIDGTAEIMSPEALHSTWEKRWRPLVEESVKLTPDPQELTELRELGKRVRCYVRLDALTPAQLVLFMRPYRDMVALGQRAGLARKTEERIQARRAKSLKSEE